jgi:hypothetical protein
MISQCNSGALRIALIVAGCSLVLPSGRVAYARPQEPVAQAITLADGTPVHLYLMDDLTSKKAKNGDAVRFNVREGIRVGDVEVIPAGSAVIGHVVDVGHSSFPGHSGKLGLSIDYAVAAHGAKIPLRGEATLKGASMGGVTAASLAWRGWNSDIHKGTMLNAYVNGEQIVTLGNPAPGVPQTNTTALLGLTVTTWEGGGAQITGLAPNSPAQTAGLQVGYVIHAVDQKPVLTAEDFETAIRNHVPGTLITIGCAFRSTAMGWMPKEVTLRLER